MTMDKKKTYLTVAVVVVVLIVVVAAAFVLISGDDERRTIGDLEDAELKVYGNINGDRYLDQEDYDTISQLIDDGATVEDYPVADANQDGVIDEEDLAVIEAVINGETTTIWHVNYHDTDGDGVMDEELVSTQFPIDSVIITASSNVAMALFSLGILDQVKGASYSSTGLDSALYGDTYLNTDKVVNIGSSSTTITFEDGQAGSSNVIAEEGVTALITDWNRTYITNEADFEAAGVDVVRISASSTDPGAMTHTYMLLGLLFQCIERAEAYLDLNLEIMDYVNSAIADAEPVSFIASSMTGYVSGADSDYTSACIEAGGVYALDDNIETGGSSSIKIEDHPEIYANYEFQYIIHIRTNMNYAQQNIESYYETYTAAFSDWEYADTGQYMVCGSLSIPLRVAYIATIFHPDLLDIDVINDFHQQLVDQFYNGLEFDIDSMFFVFGPDDVSTTS